MTVRALALSLLTLALILPVQAQVGEPIARRIARFNQLLKQQPPQGNDPVLIALMWAGTPRGSGRTIVYRGGEATPDTATVIITDENLPDDALAGQRRSFGFRRLAGVWTLVSVSESWKCRRGAQAGDYTPGICP